MKSGFAETDDTAVRKLMLKKHQKQLKKALQEASPPFLKITAAVQENDAHLKKIRNSPEMQKRLLSQNSLHRLQNSSTGAYIVGGIGCGVALIAAALCAVLFKKAVRCQSRFTAEKNRTRFCFPENAAT